MNHDVRLCEKLRRLAERMRGDPRRSDLGLYAACGAYYLFLSLGSLTALVLALLPYTPLTEETLLAGVMPFAPAPLRQLIRAMVQDVYARSRAALSLSLVLELWGGARFLASVVRSLGLLGGMPPGSYLRRRVLGAVYTAVLALFTLGNLMLLLLGQRVLLAAERICPALTGLWEFILRLRPLLFFGGLTACNALLFCRTSGGRSPRAELPGAAAAAAGWLLFTRAFSWALERFGLFGVYGSIAAAAASLCWMYGSLYILFLGAWLNAAATAPG